MHQPEASLSDWGVRILTGNECPRYDINWSDSETPALDIWKMLSSALLSLLQVPLWIRVVARDRVQSMGEIEQYDI